MPSFAERVIEKFDAAKPRRLLLKERAVRNLNDLLGNHWATKHSRSGAFYRPPDKGRVRLPDNQSWQFYQALMAKLTSNRPTLRSVPATGDAQDRHRANVGDATLRYLWRDIGMQVVLQDVFGHSVGLGKVALKPFYDLSQGEMLTTKRTRPAFMPTVNVETGKFEMVPIGREIVTGPDGKAEITRRRFKGKINVEVVPRRHLTIDPWCRRWDARDARWIIHTRYKSAKWAQEYYNIRLEKHEVEEVSAQDAEINQMWQVLTAGDAGGVHTTPPVDLGKAKIVAIHEYWERPSTDHPQGVFGVVVGKQKVRGPKRLPYRHGDLPFILFDGYPVPGRFESQSIFEILRPLQRELNVCESQIIASKNMAIKLKWLVPMGSNPTPWNNEPWQQINYGSLHGKPELMQADTLPRWVLMTADMILERMRDLAGIHKVSQAQAEGQIRSGAGHAVLLEQDESRLAPMLARNAEAFGHFGLQLLQLAQQYWKRPRYIENIGHEGDVEGLRVGGGDLVGVKDVICVQDSLFPYSKAARSEHVKGMVSEGILDPNDPNHMRLAREMMHLGGNEQLLAAARVDDIQAERENRRMAEGKRVEVEDFHEHLAHRINHNSYRKTAEYEAHPDAVKQIFREHDQSHLALMGAGAAAGPAASPGVAGPVPTAPSPAAPPPPGMGPAGGLIPEPGLPMAGVAALGQA